MAVIKCKMCGDDLVLIEGQSVAECESCGSRQTVPTADNEKKLIQFERAERLRKNCEFDKAAGLYEAIVSEYRQEAEAYWGLVLCKYGIEYVDDPVTGKKIPTCHRSSFDSIMEDSDFEQALENADAVARRVYREEAKQIEEIRKGIIAVSNNEAPYDIFICYKETDEKGDRTLDSVLAQDIYDALTEKGYRTFFARITLEDKLGQEYEPYIFAALNSARIMLAVGTDYEYYSAVWVKNEWSRYLKLMASDKTRHLIPCFKGIDAYDMPREFAKLQAQDLGKIGAMQDLLRGIEKILPRQKNTTVIQERVVVGNAGGTNKIASLLDRGNMALEDGEWDKADSFFEDVLNNDSKNAQAYLGKTLAQERCRTMDALVRKRRDVYQTSSSEKLYIQEKTAYISEMAEKFSLSGYVRENSIRKLYHFDLSYPSEVSGRQKQYREEENWWANHKLLSKAEKFASGAVAQTLQQEKKHLFAQLGDRVKKAQEADARAVAKLEAAYDAHIAEADKKAEQMYENGLLIREQSYQKWLTIAKQNEDLFRLREAQRFFEEAGDYKDSKNLAEHCRKRIADITAEQERREAERNAALAAEEKRRRIAEAEEAKRRAIAEEKAKAARKKKNKIIAVVSGIAAVIAVAVFLVVTKVVIPGNQYKAAEQLLAEGKKVEAAMAFGRAAGYQDAWERSRQLWEGITDHDTVDMGEEHSVGLKSDGTVVTAGKNDCDERNVESWTDIVAISAGYNHTVGLKSDGSVVAVGAESWFDGVDRWDNIVAISAGGGHRIMRGSLGGYTVGLKADGTVVAVGSNEYGQCDVAGWTDIIAISTGAAHTVGLKADGTVVAVGDDSERQCRGVESWDHIVAISAGNEHTVGLRANGTVVAVGYDYYDQTEVDDWTDIVAISAGDDHTVGLKANGTVVAVGDNGWNGWNQCDVYGWKDIVDINADNVMTVGLKADGTAVAVGWNDYGQCEVSNWTNLAISSAVEEQLAAMEAEKQEREAQLAAEKEAQKERAAEYYAAAVELESKGETEKAAIAFGKLGDYQDARERSLALWEKIPGEIISAKGSHTVALKTDGTVAAVGWNDDGQCDVKNWSDIVSVSAGGTYTVGLKTDGTVVTAGNNQDGQCNVENWTDILAVSAGNAHLVGRKLDGTVVAVGWNDYGQCDVEDWQDIVTVCVGAVHTAGLTADGTVVAVGDNQYGECDVEGWQDMVAVATGGFRTVGLKEDGTVVAAGWNEDGECNVEDWQDIVAVCAGWFHTVGLKADGTVVAVGSNREGQCNVQGWTDIVAIAAGIDYTVGLKADGTVVAVGQNEVGQCNVGSWRDIKLP